MDFDINRDILLSAVQQTLGIVEKKTTMPILSNLLLRAVDNHLVVVATDMEIGLTASYEALVIHEGEVTLPARKLYEMVREVQGETVHLSRTDKDVVVLKCGKSSYRIPGVPADDYPVVEENIGFSLYPVKRSILYDLMKKTYFSIANDDLRKYLNGTLLETEKLGDAYVMRMVSTDGHRLSLARTSIPREEFFLTEVGGSVIIPKKGIGEMMRLLEDDQVDEVMVGLTRGVFALKTENTLIQERLIDGTYPDYRRIIPAESGVKVMLNRDELLHAVRRMFVVSSEKHNRMIINLSHGRVLLSSANNDVGEASDEIEAQYDGDEISIAYNVKYIADVIDVIEEESVELEVNGDTKPTVIRGSGNSDYFYIVMPLRID